MSNGVLAVAVVLAAVAIICILVSTVAVLLLRRTVDQRSAMAAGMFSTNSSSDVGRAFPIGPGVCSGSYLPAHFDTPCCIKVQTNVN